MKKYIIYILSFLFPLCAISQLPLLSGDAVVTHSPINTNGSNTDANVVLRVIRTSNTSTAPYGRNWNTSSMTPTGLKPKNSFYPNWKQADLGMIFGITLDDNNPVNIYVSSTQIYASVVGTGSESKVFRIDGHDGSISLVFDFQNKYLSLGNLKYLRSGNTENIYVSNWQTGKIHRLVGNSTTTNQWTDKSQFDPNFNATGGPTNQLIYGLGVRKTGSKYRLYYARINSQSPFSSNEIWSVGLNANGDFDINDETPEKLPILSLVTNQPIADIAFTSDGKKMLIGQQTWAENGFSNLDAHRSKVYEFEDDGPNKWKLSQNNFPAGAGWSTPFNSHGKNAVGGVSYSNNTLGKDQTATGCDSTVWFTSDYIITYNPDLEYCYGIQGMKSNVGPNSSLANAVIIDEDDYTGSKDDKRKLGDVEVYKLPTNCSNCQCKSWSTDAFQVTMPGLPAPTILGCGDQLDFKCTNTEGVLRELYSCEGNCEDSTVAQVYQNGQLISTKTFPFDLSYFNQFKNGRFEIRATPWCGSQGQRSACNSCSIFINITCTPPECCADETLVVSKKTKGSIFQPSTTGYSSISQTFTINGNNPVSELRVLIEDFKLSASNPACIKCQNPPATWGSILTAAFNGDALRLDLPGNPGTTTGTQTVADYREMIYKPGALFSIKNSTLNLNLALPTVSEPECCTIYATLWVKFSFKDAQCRECIQYLPLNISIKQGKLETQPANDNPVLDRKGKPTVIKSNI